MIFKDSCHYQNMNNPFVITEPTCISFSGGRTSAYMLWRVLQANGGLPDQAVVCFANTGREHEKTLEFVERCSVEWGVFIHWVEFAKNDNPADRWRHVDFSTARRDGEPFSELNRQKNYLPSSMARYCTINLKIEPAAALMRKLGYSEWENLIGIRADEPRRVSKILAKPIDDCGAERRMPLAEAGISKADVLAFWAQQPFDLEAVSSNCDLCFLKSTNELVSLIRHDPRTVDWWIKEEEWAKTRVNDKESKGIRFRINSPSYAQMAQFTVDQRDMFDSAEEAIACFCGE